MLLRLVDELGYSLLQRLYWHNPAELPALAEWVSVLRVRVTPAVEQSYWLSAGDPGAAKADNRAVLRPYSDAMERALRRGGTNSGRRPSGYTMRASACARDAGGSIPHNVVAASNTSSNDAYARFCRDRGPPIHPVRFPHRARALLDRAGHRTGRRVFDPCAGSMTTLATAVAMGR